MRWPWTSRGRLDDALAANVELKAKNAELASENRRLVNEICKRHGVQPVYFDPLATVPVVAALPPAAPVDAMQAEAPTVIHEVRKSGARSAREICAGVESSLNRRYKEATGQIQASRPAVPHGMSQVAAEVEAVLREAQSPSTGSGTN